MPIAVIAWQDCAPDEARHLEHQLGSAAPEPGHPLPAQPPARRALPAGDQGRRRVVSRPAAEGTGLCPSGHPRAEGLPRRRHPLAPALCPHRHPGFLRRAGLPAHPGRLRERAGAARFLRSRRRRHPRSGRPPPHPAPTPKFAHKLDFLGEMSRGFEARAAERHQPVVLVGDLNVAPLEHDVWSHKQLLKVVSHTPAEVDLLNAAKAAFDWIDVTREFVPPDEKIYSWWSYRAQNWQAADKGRRLDHIWVSPGLRGAVRSHAILKPMRGWKRASDHVPVMAEIEI